MESHKLTLRLYDRHARRCARTPRRIVSTLSHRQITRLRLRVTTVVADPSSRLTLVTVVSAFPFVDVAEVVADAGAVLSGNTIVVVSAGAV